MWGHAILWAALVICLATDLKQRRIPNVVVFPAMTVGLIYNFSTGGWQGILFGLEGLGLGIALFFLPFALGGLGAGDVKLLAAVGSFGGPLFVFYAALGTALAGGLVALFILVKQRRLASSVKRIVLCMAGFFTTRSAESLKTLDKASYSESFPYGLAIVMGTLAAYLYSNVVPW